MAGVKGNKKHANKTSFPNQVKYEKWTEKECQVLFDKALELSNTAITLQDIINELGLYSHIFVYLLEKFPKFTSIKKSILENIANNTYKGALNGDYNATMAIFGLKNNHKWSDKHDDNDKDNSVTINIK